MKIAFISDIHEDILSLTEALKLIDKLGCEQIICLGDICGYSVPHYNYLAERDASACVQLIKEHCHVAVVGNHDLFALRKTPTNSPLFTYPDNWYQLTFAERRQLSQHKLWLYEDNELSALLTQEAFEDLQQLSEQQIVEFPGGLTLLLTHYVTPNLTGSMTGFITNAYELAMHWQYIRQHHCTMGISGHMHTPGLSILKNNRLQTIPYQRSSSLSGIQWIGIPAISRGKTPSGFAVMDTLAQNMTAISLRNSQRKRLRF